MLAILVVVGFLFTFDVRAQSSDAEQEQETSDPVATTAAPQARRPSWHHQRKVAKAARRAAAEANNPNAARGATPGNHAVPATPAASGTGQSQGVQVLALSAVAKPATSALAAADLNVSFFYPSIQEGPFIVQGRVTARDASGQPFDVSPHWIATDPSMVKVSPASGSAVKILVDRAGETKLTVAAPGLSKEVRISAVYRDNSLHVQIYQ